MITAYRWHHLRLIDGQGFLASTVVHNSKRSVVDGPVMDALCGRDPATECTYGMVDCACGFYAIKDPWELFSPDALPYANRGRDWEHSIICAMTRVGLFGKVVEYEKGYRASSMMIQATAIVMSGRKFTASFVNQMQRRYDAPVYLISVPKPHGAALFDYQRRPADGHLYELSDYSKRLVDTITPTMLALATE